VSCDASALKDDVSGNPHRGLLRMPCERPRGYSAAEQRDEIAAVAHSTASSARASSVGGMVIPSFFAAQRF
jgi:hypothetical protein